MIAETEILSAIAQHWAAREAEASAFNHERMEAWARRYPYDLVPVPEPSQPPEWPCKRVAIESPATVTKLISKGRPRG
jgi:hypothetical protein